MTRFCQQFFSDDVGKFQDDNFRIPGAQIEKEWFRDAETSFQTPQEVLGCAGEAFLSAPLSFLQDLGRRLIHWMELNLWRYRSLLEHCWRECVNFLVKSFILSATVFLLPNVWSIKNGYFSSKTSYQRKSNVLSNWKLKSRLHLTLSSSLTRLCKNPLCPCQHPSSPSLTLTWLVLPQFLIVYCSYFWISDHWWAQTEKPILSNLLQKYSIISLVAQGHIAISLQWSVECLGLLNATMLPSCPHFHNSPQLLHLIGVCYKHAGNWRSWQESPEAGLYFCLAAVLLAHMSHSAPLAGISDP